MTAIVNTSFSYASICNVENWGNAYKNRQFEKYLYYYLLFIIFLRNRYKLIIWNKGFVTEIILVFNESRLVKLWMEDGIYKPIKHWPLATLSVARNWDMQIMDVTSLFLLLVPCVCQILPSLANIPRPRGVAISSNSIWSVFENLFSRWLARVNAFVTTTTRVKDYRRVSSDIINDVLKYFMYTPKTFLLYIIFTILWCSRETHHQTITKNTREEVSRT